MDAFRRRAVGILPPGSLPLRILESRHTSQCYQRSEPANTPKKSIEAATYSGKGHRHWLNGDGAVCNRAVPETRLYTGDRLTQTHLQKGINSRV